MAKGGVLDALPPPEKFGAGAPPPPGEGEPDGDEYAGDDKAAQVSAMQSFLSALGLKGVDAEQACEALDVYLDSRPPEKE
jgi:hypothetical protein